MVGLSIVEKNEHKQHFTNITGEPKTLIKFSYHLLININVSYEIAVHIHV